MRGHELLFTLGRPLSPIYGAVMLLRALFYRVGIFRRQKLPVPVISIGNLTMGGTGKTPMVIHVAKLLQKQDEKVVILSRGYGGKAPGPVNVVSDGNNIMLDAMAAGDEPKLLADSLPGVAVVTGPKRAVTGRYAVENFGPGVILLDDGFQHMAIGRDLDLVLFGAATLLGNGRVFPGGELREPQAALDRAHGFIVTGVDESSRPAALSFKEYLAEHFSDRPVFFAEYKPAGLVGNRDDGPVDLEQGRKIDLYGFCGLAKPESFRRTLEDAGFRLTGFKQFKDHHAYETGDVTALIAEARASGAKGLITTEKDYVKLAAMNIAFPLFALQVELVPESGLDEFILARM